MSVRAAVALAGAEAWHTEPRSSVRLVRAVLVVDDNPDITDMLAAVLGHAGYTVSTARSAPDALEAALSRHFDLIISDIRLPGMSGHELAGLLRVLPEYRTIPLVALTGLDMYDDVERSLQAGFNLHLRKPIDPPALLKAVSGT